MTIHGTLRRAFSLAVLVVALAACSAPAVYSTAPAGTAFTETSPPTTNPTVAPTRAAATTSPGGGATVVDLTFTGDISLAAKGSAGDCELGHGADGSVIGFGFTATESDYPGLGDSFNITEDIASHKLSVKWVVANTFYAGVLASGITVSADHHSVTLDADIPAGVGRIEHVKGSISCP